MIRARSSQLELAAKRLTTTHARLADSVDVSADPVTRMVQYLDATALEHDHFISLGVELHIFKRGMTLQRQDSLAVIDRLGVANTLNVAIVSDVLRMARSLSAITGPRGYPDLVVELAVAINTARLEKFPHVGHVAAATAIRYAGRLVMFDAFGSEYRPFWSRSSQFGTDILANEIARFGASRACASEALTRALALDASFSEIADASWSHADDGRAITNSASQIAGILRRGANRVDAIWDRWLSDDAKSEQLDPQQNRRVVSRLFAAVERSVTPPQRTS